VVNLAKYKRETLEEKIKRKIRDHEMAKERTIYTKKNFGYTKKNFWVSVLGALIGLATLGRVLGLF